MLSFILVAIILFLVGCVTGELEFPATELYFTTTFTRISDGAQIRLGMHRSEIESILERVSEADEFAIRFHYPEIPETSGLYQSEIIIYYSDDDVAISIFCLSSKWTVAGGVSIGHNIRNVIDRDDFINLIHHDEHRAVLIVDDRNGLPYVMGFAYDERGRIVTMSLSAP